MRAKWLLQEDIFNEDLILLINEIVKQGMEYKIVKYIPSQQNEYSVFEENDCVICYGSINFINQVKYKKWIPNIWLNEKSLECIMYYSYYGKYLINQDYTFLPFAELKRLNHKFFDPEELFFIRPNSNMKTFIGSVVCQNNFDEIFKYSDIEPHELILFSSTKEIEAEWRFVIANKQIITGSQYKKNGKFYSSSDIPNDVFKFVEKIIEIEWQPSNVFVADIGLTKDGYGLIEIGSFNCAGLYACDRSSITKVIGQVALNEYKNCYFGSWDDRFP